jgi:hypothetical protein
LLELTGGWQDIKRELFESTFPTSGWTLSDVYPNDNKEYLWDDDNSRAHTGYRAAWPAKGGADGLDPPGDPYPPDAMSWMKYGPFDLSDAETADIIFSLWLETEANYDTVFFGVSHNANSGYIGWEWSGIAGWEDMQFGLEAYIGDASVWVGWLFQSDEYFQFEGPWVDDAVIRKYLSGQLTPQGTFYYYNRNNVQVRASYTKVYLYDADPGGTDDLLATTNTNANGFYQFPTMNNWDIDDNDPDPNNRRLDLYVVWEADYTDYGSSHHRVVDFGGQTYKWSSSTNTNAPDGTVDISQTIPSNSLTLPAMWIFQDL